MIDDDRFRSVLRYGTEREIPNPKMRDLEAALEEISTLELPVAVVSRASRWLEAEAFPEGIGLSFGGGSGEGGCSVGTDLERAAALEILDRFSRGDGSWRELTAWRGWAAPDWDAAEIEQIGKWAVARAREVDSQGNKISVQARQWILRRLIRDAVARGTGQLRHESKEVLRAVRRDLEHLILGLMRDSERPADS